MDWRCDDGEKLCDDLPETHSARIAALKTQSFIANFGGEGKVGVKLPESAEK